MQYELLKSNISLKNIFTFNSYDSLLFKIKYIILWLIEQTPNLILIIINDANFYFPI